MSDPGRSLHADRGVPRWHGPGRHLSTLGAAMPSSHIGELEQPRVGDSA